MNNGNNRKGKGKAAFIISIVAMALFAILAAAGAIVYFAKATQTFVLPLALTLSGLAGVIVCMAVMFAVIPKNAEGSVTDNDDKK